MAARGRAWLVVWLVGALAPLGASAREPKQPLKGAPPMPTFADTGLRTPRVARLFQEPPASDAPEAQHKVWALAQEAERLQPSRYHAPEEKMRAWCALAAIEEDNPHLAVAFQACGDWTQVHEDLTARPQLRGEATRDYAQLERFVMAPGDEAEKQKALEDFLRAYGALSNHRAVWAAMRALELLGQERAPLMPPPSCVRAPPKPAHVLEIGMPKQVRLPGVLKLDVEDWDVLNARLEDQEAQLVGQSEGEGTLVLERKGGKRSCLTVRVRGRPPEAPQP